MALFKIIRKLKTQVFLRKSLIICLSMLYLFNSNLALSQTYKLGPGDLINISVYQEADLSLQVLLNDIGIINYPFIGEISVLGSTTAEVETLIEQLLISGEFFIRPDASVSILQYRPFYIDGEVAAPGRYPFEPGLTLREAISIAGGFTERASRSNITILNNTIQDLEDAELENDAPADFLDTPVSPDDIITVSARFF